MMYRLIVISVVSAAASAQQSLELLGRSWSARFSGSVQVEAGGFGTSIDARNELGITGSDLPEGGVTWRHGNQRLQFLYTPIDLSGDRVVTRTVTFRGQEYTIGTRIVSDLEIKQLQLNWAWQFIHTGNGVFRLGPMVEADGFVMHGSLAAPDISPPINEKEDLSVGLPTAGLALDIQPRKWLDIYGQASGMDVGGYGYFIGSDAGVKLRLGHLLLTGGYRTFNLHVDVAPDFVRVQLRGPFVGAGIGF